MQDYLAKGERRKEAGSGKREEEKEVKGRKWRNTWLQGRSGRKQEAGRVKRRRKCRTTWLQGRGGRKQEAGRGKRRRK